MKFPRVRFALALSVAVVAVGAWYFLRDGARQTRARYTKREYRIPMRDGVTLFTQVYVPRDISKTYPFLIQRTPFSVQPYGGSRYRPQLGPGPEFDRAGYIFVFQDVRGRFQSEGSFVDMRPHIDRPAPGQTDESTDMYDTVEWLLKNVPNNGRVGIWGLSYAGFYTSASIIDSHPAIKAASPQAPMTNLFLGDDAYHNGAFMLAQQFQIYANYFKPRTDGPEFPSSDIGRFFDYRTSDGYQFFLAHGPGVNQATGLVNNRLLDENIRHDTFDDYWKARDISEHLHNVHCPVLIVGGWFDAEDLAGTFRTYRAIANTNPGLTSVLVMGPWGHKDWLRSPGNKLGPLEFGSHTGAFFRGQVLFPFFEHYLKDAPAPHIPGALAFETGSNQWRRYESWPPPGALPRNLYLHANGKLTFDPPSQQEKPYDEFVSDPAKPVPYVEHPPTELAPEYMYADQRFATGRADVLTYKTDALDKDVTVAGPITVLLHVSSSGSDSDFDVKLIDEYPESPASPGYQLLVRGEPMRVRFRNSFSNPEALEPDKVTLVQFAMPDVNHTFLRGHRILVQVQSSWFPLVDRNPQTFLRIPEARPTDFVRANQRVFHAPQADSAIVLPILEN